MDRTIHTIRQRAAELDRRIADWEMTGMLLREEREELRAFMRVYERFAEDGDAAPESPEPDLAARMVGAESEPIIEQARSPTSKPEGAPTVPEMVFDALAAADMLGKAGLPPKEITAYIRQKWWRDAPSDSIGPIVWRMWAKDKRLDKVGDLYALKADPSGQLFQHHDGDAPSKQEGAG
jgi:hypothetical protein